VHELGWSMHGDANGEVTFVTPTGQTMISVPSPTWRAQGQAQGQLRSKAKAKADPDPQPEFSVKDGARRAGSGKVAGSASTVAAQPGPESGGQVSRR
jgi:hypothetical protein